MKYDITSLQNERIKHVVRLKDEKRQRQRERLIVVEGWDEIRMALASGLKPKTVFASPELVSRPLEIDSGDVLTVTRPVFEKMSHRENPDGWLAIFPMPTCSLDTLVLRTPPLLIVAEAVEKPGNLGAILRTADAAGVDAVLVCDPRVDIWNPNVIRASRGTVFSVPVVQTDNSSALTWLRAQKIGILAATPSAKLLYTDTNLHQPVAIAVGTEDEGLSQFWLEQADWQVQIPMVGRVNSLNVSIATALIVYEAVRQRRSSP